MRLQRLPTTNAVISLVKCDFHSVPFPNVAQSISKVGVASEELMSKLLDRRWTLTKPDTKIHQIIISNRDKKVTNNGFMENLSFVNNPQPSLSEKNQNHEQPSFYIVRDDLLHPLVNGNKARKLDAILPLLQDSLITDVVTCGGCQSAHAAAVAVSCAEMGLRSHLLLRGEQPQTLTGYNLISTLYGNVTYVPRSLYSMREEMLTRHADLLAGSTGLVVRFNELGQKVFHDCDRNVKKVAIINEGAGDMLALLGVIRLVKYISENNLFGKKEAMKIVIDSGTGTTAIGFALGIMLLGLPWEVTAVMLADTIDGYKKKEESLISEFCKKFNSSLDEQLVSRMNGGIVHWVERSSPRKFGNILRNEMKECQKIAQQTGVLVDPIYTLAAWEMATSLSDGDVKVVMIHTGGTLGMFGLAQRYTSYFQMLDVNDGTK